MQRTPVLTPIGSQLPASAAPILTQETGLSNVSHMHLAMGVAQLPKQGTVHETNSIISQVPESPLALPRHPKTAWSQEHALDRSRVDVARLALRRRWASDSASCRRGHCTSPCSVVWHCQDIVHPPVPAYVLICRSNATLLPSDR